MPRAGEIEPKIKFAREAWSQAEQLEFDQNGNAASIRTNDSTNTFTECNVITVNEFKSHARVNRELPSDIVIEKDATLLHADPQREGLVRALLKNPLRLLKTRPADRGNAETCHQRLPRSFTYVGGSNAEVLAGTKTAVLLDSDPEVLSKTEQVNILIQARFLKSRAMVADWCQALRLHHWVKNTLLFVPLVFDHSPALSTWLTTFAGFLLLSICASGTYILNDVSDLEADRAHPQKQHRPFAAGRLHIASGLVVAGILILSSLAGAMFLSLAFTALLLLYLILTLTYSFKLKRLPLLDVTTLAGLHTLRLGMGIILSQALLPGLLVFAASLSFLSLALAKRHSEIVKTGTKYSASTSGRGYFATDANIALAVGVGSALVATQATVSYLLEKLPAEMLSRTTLLWPIPVLSCTWLIRIWLLANRGQLNEDLAMFALRDTFTAAVAVFLASSVLLAG